MPPGVTLRDIDGGLGYFSRWPNTFPTNPSFFPIGVWFESVVEQRDVDLDKAAGLNTYVVITRNSNLDLVAAAGMYTLAQSNEWLGVSHQAITGWVVSDEADMVFGPGWDAWDGVLAWNHCIPPNTSGGRCGYTVQRTINSTLPNDGKPRYSNYGKGVIIWQSDKAAQVFVNLFQDFVSSDVYWFTDNHECVAGTDPACRSGAQYGRQVDKMRRLDAVDGRRQPVWAFVEAGHPSTEHNFPTIQSAQIRSAVWHSIIAGARGIIYFNHSFGGSCQTQHILRDSCYASVRATVAEVNRQITELAPVLNSPFADRYVTVSGGVRVMAKRGPDETWYVFAGSTGGATTAIFTVAAGSTVEVLYEDRVRLVTTRQFTDSFADANAVHIYRITS